MVIELVKNIVGPEPTERDKNIRYHVRMGTAQVDFDFYVYDHFPVVKTMVEVRSKVDGTVYHRFTDTVEKRHWHFVDAVKRCLNNWLLSADANDDTGQPNFAVRSPSGFDQ